MGTPSASPPLHVLHVSHGVNTGLAHCVANYVDYQVSHGLTVSVACPGGRLGELATRAGAKVVAWHAGRQPGMALLGEIASLRRIVRTSQPDVVHLHCAKAGLVGRMVLRGAIPTLFSPHAWSFMAVDGFMRRLVREWERFANRWTNATVCVSEAEATTGRRNGIHNRVVTLPNQLDGLLTDGTFERITARVRADVRAELGISPGEPLAVCAARLCRQKGQDVAIAAWPQVRDVVPTAELALLGDGPDRTTLQAAAGSGIRFTGVLPRDATLRWMFAADVVVCPSRWEGMSLVPLEAMALGRPVIASDVDGMRETVPGGTGWLIQPDDVSAFAETTAKVLADPASAFDAGQLALSHATAVAAQPNNSAAQLVDLYHEVTSRA